MKRLRNSNSNTTLEMNVVERMSNQFDKAHVGESSVSLKVRSKIGGQKLEKHAALVKAATDQAQTEADGSISFRVTKDTAIRREGDIIKILDRIHAYTDSKLGEVYDMLSSEHKQNGLRIAIQNRARNLVMEMSSGTAITINDVSDAMQRMNIVYIPEGCYFECDITMGTNMYTEPRNLLGFKEHIDETIPGTPKVWRKTSSCYGRKRVPIKSDAADQYAIDVIFNLAKSFETAMNSVDGGDDDAVLDAVLAWSDTLEVPKDYEIDENQLDTKSELEARDMAEKVYDFMKRGR